MKSLQMGENLLVKLSFFKTYVKVVNKATLGNPLSVKKKKQTAKLSIRGILVFVLCGDAVSSVSKHIFDAVIQGDVGKLK